MLRTKEHTVMHLQGLVALLRIQQAFGIGAVEALIADWRRVCGRPAALDLQSCTNDSETHGRYET
jgi:hypothetical protein